MPNANRWCVSRLSGAECKTFRVPLNGPVHGSVGDNEGRGDVEDLVTESAPDVEDSGVSSAGHGPLSVGGEGVGNDVLLRGRAAWMLQIERLAPFFRPFERGQHGSNPGELPLPLRLQLKPSQQFPCSDIYPVSPVFQLRSRGTYRWLPSYLGNCR